MKFKRASLLIVGLMFLAQSVEWVRQTEIALLVAPIKFDAMTALEDTTGCIFPSNYQTDFAANVLKILSSTVRSDPITALKSQNANQRFLGAFVLTESNLERKAAAIPPLQLALRDSDSDTRIFAFKTLSEMNAITIPEIREGLRGDRKTVRAASRAARKLGQKAKPVASELLKVSLGDICPTISAEYVLQNIGIDPATSVEVFREALKHPDRGVRQSAIGHLAKMGKVALPALPELKAIVDDPPDLRLHNDAADAIRRIKYGGASRLGGG